MEPKDEEEEEEKKKKKKNGDMMMMIIISQVQISSVSAYTFCHGTDMYVCLMRIIQHNIHKKLQLNETNA